MCGGCSYWNIDYPTEIQLKKENLKSLLKSLHVPIRVINTDQDYFKFRTRFDFTIESSKMGLYSKKHDLMDLNSCSILHPELEKAYIYFRNFCLSHKLNIKKGSVRIRISADLNRWGVWLDFSNLEIKDLLLEKTFLMMLSEKFTIEIGQKKKRLDLKSFTSDQLKLTDPAGEAWFKTQNKNLRCSVASFTQPSWFTADLLTYEILNWLLKINVKHILEYGSGIGQYTLPLLNSGYSVDIFESDMMALDYLKENCNEHKSRIRINPTDQINLNNAAALVNPPRSGLQKFNEKLINSNVEYIIYISCYPESLALDLEILEDSFEVKDIILVDQFMRTKHFEAGVLLQRIK